MLLQCIPSINPIALRKAKIVYNFGILECSRVIAGSWSLANCISVASVLLKCHTPTGFKGYKLDSVGQILSVLPEKSNLWLSIFKLNIILLEPECRVAKSVKHWLIVLAVTG